MIPNLVMVRYRGPEGRGLRLYIPVLPVVLLLSPLLLLAMLGGLVACLFTGISPAGALRGLGQVVWALPGTRIEVEQGRTIVLVSVR
jgi:hypothetical protein